MRTERPIGPFPPAASACSPHLLVPWLALGALAAGEVWAVSPRGGALLLGLSLLGAWRGFSRTAFRGAAGAALVLLAAAAARWHPGPPSPPAPLGEPLRFRGVVARDPSAAPVGPRLWVDVEAVAPAATGPWRPRTGRVALQVIGRPAPAPARGETVVFRGRLRPPTSFRNPGSESYARYLERHGVGARASARWPGQVLVAAPARRQVPGWLRWRRRLGRAISEASPGPGGAVLRAVVTGDRSQVTPSTREGFRRAGTGHLVAISGLHLGILALLIAPIWRALLVRIPGYALAHPVAPGVWAATLPALVGYAALSGFQISTVRALVMVAVTTLAAASSRATSPLTILAATVLALALGRPAILADAGLHLSVAALAGLFWLAPRLEARLTPPADPLAKLLPASAPRRCLTAARTGLLRCTCASLAATVATAPVTLFHFGHAAVAGLALNPLAVPLVGFVCLPLGLTGAAVHPLWPGAARAAWALAGALLDRYLQLQEGALAHLPPWPALPPVTCLGAIGAGGLVAWLGLAVERRGRSRAGRALLAGSLALLALPPAFRWARAAMDPGLHLWVIDVGQGQAVAGRLPGARWILVDGGGLAGSDFDVGRHVVVPALRHLGAGRLAVAVSTHPHPDHLAGLDAAVRWGRPEQLWLPESFHDDPRYRTLLEAACRAGTRVVWVGPGGREESFGGGRIQVAWVPGATENDRSLAVRLEAGGRAALIPGDLEVDGQQRLLATDFPVRCDVLVAPHHGAANALYLPFLEAARPRQVVVSAAGRPGLPSARFVAAAQALGAPVRSTHREGCLRADLTPGQVFVSAAVH
ncbi:MAG: DNA internalization-related competence protein ComEC/Rec2 [Deferrisomatales bacterium]